VPRHVVNPADVNGLIEGKQSQPSHEGSDRIINDYGHGHLLFSSYSGLLPLSEFSVQPKTNFFRNYGKAGHQNGMLRVNIDK